MAVETIGSELHEHGLRESRAGHFVIAARLLNKASDSYLDAAETIHFGSAQRDLAGVYAGLGSVSGRADALAEAQRIHGSMISDTSTSRGEAVSELAVTTLVTGRVCVAQMAEIDDSLSRREVRERKHQLSDEAVEFMIRAFELITSTPGTNEDYLQQIAAHGGLIVSTYGPSSSLPIADRMAGHPGLKNMSNKARRNATALTTGITIARGAGIPVHLAAIRIVNKRVGGPYIIKNK